MAAGRLLPRVVSEGRAKMASAVYGGVTAGAFRRRLWGAKSGDGARHIPSGLYAIDRTGCRAGSLGSADARVSYPDRFASGPDVSPGRLQIPTRGTFLEGEMPHVTRASFCVGGFHMSDWVGSPAL